MEEEILENEAPAYLWAGRALCEAQNVERYLANLIVVQQMVNCEIANVPSLEEVYSSYDRKTLGRLLVIVRKFVPIAPEFDAKLSRGLDTRNRLVHRYFGDLFEEHGYTEAMKIAPVQLRQFAEELSEITTELLNLTISFASAVGLTPEMVNKRFVELGDEFRVDWHSR